MFVTTITQKGQVTIPKEIRDKLGIAVNSPVLVTEEAGKVTLLPRKNILSMAGKFKPRNNKNTNPLKARETLDTNYERP